MPICGISNKNIYDAQTHAQDWNETVTPPNVKPETASTDESSSEAGAEADSASTPPAKGVTRLRAGTLRKGPGLGPRAQLRRAQAAEGEEDGSARPGSGQGQGMGRGRGLGGGGMGGGMGRGGMQRARKAQEDAVAVMPVPHPGDTAEAAQVEPGALAPAGEPLVADGQVLRSEIVTPAAPQTAPSAQAPQPLSAPSSTPSATPGRDFLDEDDDEEDDTPAGRPGTRPGARPGRKARPARAAMPTYVPIAAVQPARMHTRHWGLLALFLLMVAIPTGVYSWYMYARAADQYESNVGFGSRTESAVSPFAFLGALGGMGGGNSGSDMDILAQFIYSQELVARIDAKLDLRKVFSKPENDPLMSFPKDGTVEDLVNYWQSMVKANYDPSSGLMKLQVFAFDPNDAQDIAREILAESTSIINELSVTAQTDSTRYSKDALEKAKEEMASANKALTDFRIKHHIIDPGAQLAGATQVVNTLVQQMAAAQIDLDLLTGTVPATDPRIGQLQRRIEVIQNRIKEEQSKVGSGLSDPDSPGYANLVVEYQNLQMQQDFASKAYVTALGAYDQAVNAAQQKTHYLATYLSPTLAESSTAPNRPLRIFLLALIGLLSWSALTMIYYALRDRR